MTKRQKTTALKKDKGVKGDMEENTSRTKRDLLLYFTADSGFEDISHLPSTPPPSTSITSLNPESRKHNQSPPTTLLTTASLNFSTPSTVSTPNLSHTTCTFPLFQNPSGQTTTAFPGILTHNPNSNKLTAAFVAGWKYNTTTSAHSNFSSSHSTCSRYGANEASSRHDASQSDR